MPLSSIQGLLQLLNLPPAVQAAEDAMNPDERGYSGAKVLRVSVACTDGRRQSVILKRAPLPERLAMAALTRQNRHHTPAAFSDDTQTDAPQWMAQEDLGPAAPIPDTPEWLQSAAIALAQIHFDNFKSSIPNLPSADAPYWHHLLTELTVTHFANKIERSPAFAREFGAYLSPLQKAAERFAQNMTALFREGDSLTLTHGDLQTLDGDHIRNRGGRPCIIDFGFCRRAPLYIDLAGCFTPDETEPYRRELDRLGHPIPLCEFRDRLRAATPYAGFVYLCPALIQWADGPTEQTGRRLLQLLKIIFSGDFPERRIRYSDALFATLLSEHRAGGFLP